MQYNVLLVSTADTSQRCIPNFINEREMKKMEKRFSFIIVLIFLLVFLSLSKNYIGRLIKDIAGAFILALYYLRIPLQLAIRDKRIAMIDLYDL